MIADTHTDTVGDLEAAVCIVGAGAAGITLARALDARGIDCVLLEGGGPPFEDRDARDLYRGEAVATHVAEFGGYLQASRLRMFGGSTNHWVGWCRPLDAFDFEARPWVPGSGWPFGRSELEPYYREAAEVLEIEPFDAPFDSAPGAAAFPSADSAFERAHFCMSPPTRMGLRERGAIASSERIRAVLHANLVGLERHADGRRIDAVRVQRADGREIRVRAAATVLATGGIENARILLASNLGNEHDLVGRFFMDHPHVRAGHVVWTPPPGVASPFEARRPKGFRCNVVPVLTRTAAVQRERQLTNADLVFTRVDPDLVAAAGATSRVASLAGKAGRETFAAELRLRLEPVPNPASRVVLAEDRDRLGLPRASLEWRLGEADARSAEAALAGFARELGRSGWGRAQTQRIEADPWPETTYGAHHVGTTRMHDDPKQGVVNAQGRVHAVSNLYVAGSSVFPTAGSANPTLTIVALALRLGAQLQEALR